MGLHEILALIDTEIARLQEAKSLLSGAIPEGSIAVRRGRPKMQADGPAAAPPTRKKRKLTPEGRARIAEAVKRRWATQKAKQRKA